MFAVTPIFIPKENNFRNGIASTNLCGSEALNLTHRAHWKTIYR